MSANQTTTALGDGLVQVSIQLDEVREPLQTLDEGGNWTPFVKDSHESHKHGRVIRKEGFQREAGVSDV
jgi:hypothetical protein